MEKLSVQDLAMFLGCKIEVYYPKPRWINTTHPHYNLVGVNMKTNEVCLESSASVSLWYSIVKEKDYWEYMKPVLRQFSDMTEDEVFEFATIIGFWVEGTTEEYIRKRTYTVISQLEKEVRCPPDGVKYLISKHFDIFGWIEKGLALDKTKLK